VILELKRLEKEDRKEGSGAESGVPSSAYPLESRPFLDRLILQSSFNALRIFFRTYFRMEVDGQEVIPKKRAFIIAANHNSHLDSGAIIAALSIAMGRRQAYRLHVLGARDYFFKSKLKGWLVSRFLNVVPIERREASLSSLRLVKGILENKESVLIFPEGTRSRSGELQEFKAGLGLMAWEADTTIIPAFIDGTVEAMPVGQAFPRPKKIRVHFGEPVSMGSYSAEDWERKDLLYRQIVEDVRAAVQDAGD
jgi:long-chain acyl-CoA synthetase